MQFASLSGRTVCLLDGDKAGRILLALQIRGHGLEVLEVSTGPELIGLVGRQHIDCILIDYCIGLENGLFIHSQLRQIYGRTPPVIMLTATDDQKVIIRAFRLGVSDYLIKKDLRFEDLLQSLRSAIDKQADADMSTAEIERLRARTAIDEATGLYRKEAVDAMLISLIETSAKTGKSFAMILLRVNDFAVIQSRYGQVIARKAFESCASKVRKIVRNTDICGCGGDNSLVYVIDKTASRPDTDVVVARLREATSFDLNLDSLSMRISAEFGVAHFPEDGVDVEGLLREAGRGFAQAPALPGRSRDAEGTPSRVRTSDRRIHVRQRVYKSAKILIGIQGSVIDCTLRDLSAGGARLRLTTECNLPFTFELQIMGAGPAQGVRLIWHREHDVGVEFLS